MFEGSKFQNIIPGYTGHIPSIQEEDDMIDGQSQKNRIPGYAGYIPGVRSENLFGKTYGKITYECNNDMIPRARDLAPEIRYTSTTKQAYVNPQQYKLSEKQKKEEIEESLRQKGNLTADSVYSFWGVTDPNIEQARQQNQQFRDSYANSSNQFGQTDYRQQSQTQQNRDDKFATITYEEARKMAYQN